MDTLIDLFEYKGFNIYVHHLKYDPYDPEWFDYQTYLKLAGKTEVYVSFGSNSITDVIFQTKDFIDSTQGMVYDL